MNGVVLLCLSILFAKASITTARNQQQRIVGGQSAQVSAYPFVVRLILLSKNGNVLRARCGATIIHKKWVITAAHCLDRFTLKYIDEKRMFIRGNTTHSRLQTDAIDHRIVYHFIHEDFQEFSNAYDIALIQVLEPFQGASEKRIRTAGPNYKYKVASPATLLGWGMTDKRATIRAASLRATHTTLVSQDSCHVKYQAVAFFNPIIHIHVMTPDGSQICTWSNGKDACEEDDGGPLVQKNTLIGIISARTECAGPYFPTVHVKISYYSDWIKDVISTTKRKRIQY